MVVLAFSLLAPIGVAMYLFCTNPKFVEIGRIAFFVGLLAFALNGARWMIEIIQH